MVGWCPVVELRQYTLRPGQRDVLVELFDRQFIEPQEAVGMEIVGQFRDLDRPERFVWLRGFPTMERRRESLAAFYGGPQWKSHAQAANATMVDVDDVLLLRPVGSTDGFGPQPSRPAPGVQAPGSVILATICSLARTVDVGLVEDELVPALEATGSPPLATFVEEPGENTFPALPMRTGEHVVVWIQRPHVVDADGRASAELAGELLQDLVGPPVQLRLEPTPRSRLR